MFRTVEPEKRQGEKEKEGRKRGELGGTKREEEGQEIIGGK